MTLLADRTAELAACGERPVLQVLRGLESGLRGLTEGEASARLERDGENEIARPDALAGHGLATAFQAPFLLVLIVLDVVLAISADLGGVLAITAMIVIAALMRFWQERRSRRTVDALRALVLTTATVVRRADADSQAIAREVPVDQLVVGDVVRLAAGDLIPADLRLLRSKDLFLDQSLLSGESMPVGKHAELSAGAAGMTAAIAAAATPTSANTPIADSHPCDHLALCLAGTHVLSGTATAVVIATGARTYLAGLGRELDRTRPATAFDRGVASVSWMLLRFMLLLAPLVFAVSGLATGSWHRAFLFAVAVAVGITPEMLPVVVTTTLARGAVTMARRRVIVKRLPAIQDLGAMDVLCVDKTGTLTEGTPALDRHTDAWGRVDETVLDYAALNSLFQSGWHNPLDEAVLAYADALALPADSAWEKIDEIPFDFTRRRMSVVIASADGFEPEHVIITKGSVEEVVACCVSVLDDGRAVPLEADLRARIDDVTAAERDAGLQLLAVAVRSTGMRSGASGAFGAARPASYTVADEAGLTLVGLLGFTDPAKDTAVAALADLAARGVDVKVVTGDEPSAAARICRDVGLDPGTVVDGRTLSALDDDALAALAGTTTVFAKTDPLAKARVVEALRRAGHTVGYLGDGVNDAPALHAADVGLTAPDATDLARETADVILLDKDLTVLAAGVEEGRRTLVNSQKYIRAATSSNFGNVLSVTAAAAFLPFLPMLPIQLLVQNLLYDLSQLALPWDSVDEQDVARPRRWDSAALRRFMLRLGPISSLFDLVTWALLWWVLAPGDSRISLFQTGWFAESLLSQLLAVHIIRTRRLPFVSSRASRPVLLVTGAGMALGLFLPFSMLAAGMGMTKLPAPYFGFLALILLGYCVLLQTAKLRFGETD